NFEESVSLLKAHGLARDIEIHLIRKDRTVLPVLVSATAVRDFEANLVGSRWVLYDLTERNRTEQRLQGVLQATPDAIVTVNQDGTIVLANTQVEKLFGYRHEELLGQKVEMLVPERFRNWHVGHRADYFSQPRIRPMGAGLALYALRKDGTEFPVEISLI